MRYLYLIIGLTVMGCTHIPAAEVQAPTHAKQKVVVTDIDGTLTPDVLAMNEVRPGAAKLLRSLTDKGYSIVYLTARIPMFQSALPRWLKENGFPEGALHVAQSNKQSRHPEELKAGILKDYVQKGWQLAYAFGDPSTDFAAYADAGIPQQRVFALQRRGSEGCQPGIYQACLKGWRDVLPYLQSLPASEQMPSQSDRQFE